MVQGTGAQQAADEGPHRRPVTGDAVSRPGRNCPAAQQPTGGRSPAGQQPGASHSQRRRQQRSSSSRPFPRFRRRRRPPAAAAARSRQQHAAGQQLPCSRRRSQVTSGKDRLRGRAQAPSTGAVRHRHRRHRHPRRRKAAGTDRRGRVAWLARARRQRHLVLPARSRPAAGRGDDRRVRGQRDDAERLRAAGPGHRTDRAAQWLAQGCSSTPARAASPRDRVPAGTAAADGSSSRSSASKLKSANSARRPS